MKVLVTCIVPEEVTALIKKEHDLEANEEDRPMPREKLLKGVEDKDGLLCNISDAIDRELLDRAPRLKVLPILESDSTISTWKLLPKDPS